MSDVRAARGRDHGGKRIRLSRISDPRTGRGLIVAMDHSVTLGPLGSVQRMRNVMQAVADGGADALVLHRGRVRTVPEDAFARVGLIVHLSAGTSRSMDSDAKVLVGGVEDALRVGADAVSIHVNIGSPTESRQLEDFWAVSRECDTLGVPLLAMVYSRGPHRPAGPVTADEVAHMAAIATDLGADVVKVDYCGNPDEMRTVVDSCPLPLYVAGGSQASSDSDAVALGAEIMSAGVSGLAFGRNVFGATDPYGVTKRLSRIVHGDPSPMAVDRAGTLESA
ncbi:2-amino-3,7-dideoxy-D-threo-hept-6-ulosonate synthase [Gordonia aurantiaca]|uniref:2-amino-3,7-dideoxy-D-threo-hept-6-ulosonate synthase n=1 Tax=Gordonia sp. B21 TaxID=3151852 RepID=UPI0032640EEC